MPPIPSPTPSPELGLTWLLDSVVISIFAIVILSILGLLFKANHPELVGGNEDPSNGPQVATTVFTAVIIYVVRFPSKFLYDFDPGKHCIRTKINHKADVGCC